MKIIYFLGHIAAIGLKVGWSIQLNELMKLNEYQRSMSFFDLGQRSLIFQNKNLFSQKLVGHLKPNFIWKLMGEFKWIFLQMSWVIWPRWLPCPHMVKTYKNLLLQNSVTDGLRTWYVALGTWVLPRLFKWWSWVDRPWSLMARSNMEKC